MKRLFLYFLAFFPLLISARVTERSFPNGTVLTCTYDENNYLIEELLVDKEDEILVYKELSYDENFNIIELYVKDKSHEKRFWYEYNEQRQMLKKSLKSDDNPITETNYLYDENNRLIKIILPTDVEIDYSYDEEGVLVSIVSSDASIDYRVEIIDDMLVKLIDNHTSKTMIEPMPVRLW
ncbi:MAG TPA: RHS repeat protein [Chlamydiales bacterium]|nr:RHS repeat protein [Chlamydiales bacterium]